MKLKIPKSANVRFTREQLNNNGFRSAHLMTVTIVFPDGKEACAALSAQLDYRGLPTLKIEDFNSGSIPRAS